MHRINRILLVVLIAAAVIACGTVPSTWSPSSYSRTSLTTTEIRDLPIGTTLLQAIQQRRAWWLAITQGTHVQVWVNGSLFNESELSNWKVDDVDFVEWLSKDDAFTMYPTAHSPVIVLTPRVHRE